MSYNNITKGDKIVRTVYQFRTDEQTAEAIKYLNSIGLNVAQKMRNIIVELAKIEKMKTESLYDKV